MIRTPEIFVGDTGDKIVVTLDEYPNINFQDADVKILLIKPTGQVNEFNTVIEGNDAYYITQNGDIDVPGVWRARNLIAYQGYIFYTKDYEFNVYPQLPFVESKEDGLYFQGEKIGGGGQPLIEVRNGRLYYNGNELGSDTSPIPGGLEHQVLTKQSDADGDYDWEYPAVGGGGSWGSIIGDIATQTDLQTALNGKVNAGTLTESVQDIMASTLVGASGITVNYNDGANTLTISATGGGGGGGTWGSITGTLSSQTDLQTALSGKASTSHTHTSSQITDFIESVQDIVGNGLLIGGNNITVTYNDPSGIITIDSSGGGGGSPGGSNKQIQYNNSGSFGGTNTSWDNTNKRLGINTDTPSGTLDIIPNSSGEIAQIIRGLPNQSGDLQQWRSSNNTVLAKINNVGMLGINSSNPSAFIDCRFSGIYNYGLIVQSLSSPQQYPLISARDYAGSQLCSIEPNGSYKATGVAGSSTSYATLGIYFANNNLSSFFGYAAASIEHNLPTDTSLHFANRYGSGANKIEININGGNMIINNKHTSDIAQIIVGASGQTADLSRWRDYSGTVLASISKDGHVSTSKLNIKNASGSGIMLYPINNDYFGFSNIGSGWINTINTNDGRIGLNCQTPSGQIHAVSYGSGIITSIFQGVSTQTADLTQWRDYSGTVKAKVDILGNFTANNIPDSINIDGVNFYLANPTDQTAVWISSARYNGTINSLHNLKTASGTLTLTVKINGTDVTGLSSLSVTSTPQSPTATANNTFVVGDRITLMISDSSSPVDLETTMKITR